MGDIRKIGTYLVGFGSAQLQKIDRGFVYLTLRPARSGGGQSIEIVDNRPSVYKAASAVFEITERISERGRKAKELESLRNSRKEALVEFGKTFKNLAKIGIQDIFRVFAPIQQLVFNQPGKDEESLGTLTAVRTRGRYEIEGERIGKTIYSRDHEWALHLVAGSDENPAKVWDLKEDHVMCFVVTTNGYKVLEGDLKPRIIKEDIEVEGKTDEGNEKEKELEAPPENGGSPAANSSSLAPPSPVEKVSRRQQRRQATTEVVEKEEKPSRRRERKARRGESE